MPPAPTAETIWYGPSRVPADKVIRSAEAEASRRFYTCHHDARGRSHPARACDGRALFPRNIVGEKAARAWEERGSRARGTPRRYAASAVVAGEAEAGDGAGGSATCGPTRRATRSFVRTSGR